VAVGERRVGERVDVAPAVGGHADDRLGRGAEEPLRDLEVADRTLRKMRRELGMRLRRGGATELICA
jgi:hypothetical protein